MPRWKKLGLIFTLASSPARLTTHAQVPTVLVKKDCVRVYFAARNLAGKSYPSYFDLARDDLTKVIKLHDKPLIDFGAPGAFDDEGVMPAHVMEQGSEIWMYTTGWNKRGIVPYHNATGLLVSTDGGESFTRKFAGPLLDRTPEEPGLAVTPCILKEGNAWHCWYSSGLRWEKIGDKYEPIYVVKYAFSTDGIHWQRPNIECIPQSHPLEASSNPAVIKKDGIYHMWYCFRDSTDFRGGKGSYRIGYAHSKDGKHFTRDDANAGLGANEAWESNMQCYPYVLAIDGKTYMFYNGNDFGQSGVGLALLQE